MTKILIAFCFLLLPWQVMAAVQVKVYGQHYGSQVIYHYQIVNNSPEKVYGIIVGYGPVPPGAMDNQSYGDTPELVSWPSGWEARELRSLSGDVDYTLVPGTSTSPPGWTIGMYLVEERDNYGLEWELTGLAASATDPNVDGREIIRLNAVQPGVTLGGMSVTLDAADASYINNHVRIYNDSARIAGVKPVLVVPLEKLDTTPPTLTLTVSPSRLQATAGKLVTVTATVTTKDDYDPQPEIKLESITANEPLATGDIAGAALGTNDRQFQLRDVKVPRGSAGRIYTITYSATDATGNKATASATVRAK